jgi:hypothetical protein
MGLKICLDQVGVTDLIGFHCASKLLRFLLS